MLTCYFAFFDWRRFISSPSSAFLCHFLQSSLSLHLLQIEWTIILIASMAGLVVKVYRGQIYNLGNHLFWRVSSTGIKSTLVVAFDLPCLFQDGPSLLLEVD